MKVNIDIECTPIEARQFLGLPNVEPMQTAVMEQLQKRILAEVDRFSSDALMKTWLPLLPQGSDQIQAFFRNFFPSSSTTSTPKEPKE